MSVVEFAAGLSDSLDSPNLAAAQAIPGAAALQSAYWRLVRLVVRELRPGAADPSDGRRS